MISLNEREKYTVKSIKLLYYTDIDLNDKHICNYKCFRDKEKLLEEILYG